MSSSGNVRPLLAGFVKSDLCRNDRVSSMENRTARKLGSIKSSQYTLDLIPDAQRPDVS